MSMKKRKRRVGDGGNTVFRWDATPAHAHAIISVRTQRYSQVAAADVWCGTDMDCAANRVAMEYVWTKVQPISKQQALCALIHKEA